MEEDIKILEELKDVQERCIEHTPDSPFTMLWKKQNQAIENLLKRYKELEEDNKTLTDEYMIQKHLINANFLKDYIPISVIQNKLEQNKAKTDCRYCNNACDSYAVCTVLKEILEKGNK